MIIKDVQFVISNTDYRKCPEDGRPEFAFIGRSNVGKSSLINMLANRKGLALSSSKPGKTQLINHFDVNGEWYLVDLPGYGYAQRGKKGREMIRKIIDNYIKKREQLTCLFLLIDCRHEMQQIDADFINWLGGEGVPFVFVFTKIDKISKRKLEENLKSYKLKLSETWDELPPMFCTSSDHKIGREELLDYIESVMNELKKNN